MKLMDLRRFLKRLDAFEKRSAKLSARTLGKLKRFDAVQKRTAKSKLTFD